MEVSQIKSNKFSRSNYWYSVCSGDGGGGGSCGGVMLLSKEEGFDQKKGRVVIETKTTTISFLWAMTILNFVYRTISGIYISFVPFLLHARWHFHYLSFIIIV